MSSKVMETCTAFFCGKQAASLSSRLSGTLIVQIPADRPLEPDSPAPARARKSVLLPAPAVPKIPTFIASSGPCLVGNPFEQVALPQAQPGKPAFRKHVGLPAGEFKISLARQDSLGILRLGTMASESFPLLLTLRRCVHDGGTP